MKRPADKKRSITVFLSEIDFERLDTICKDRSQSRADFLRAAMQIHEQVPMLNTRPLVGACLAKHLKKVEREKKAGRRSPEKG